MLFPCSVAFHTKCIDFLQSYFSIRVVSKPILFARTSCVFFICKDIFYLSSNAVFYYFKVVLFHGLHFFSSSCALVILSLQFLICVCNGIPYSFCGAFSFTHSQSSLYIYLCSCWYHLFRNFSWFLVFSSVYPQEYWLLPLLAFYRTPVTRYMVPQIQMMYLRNTWVPFFVSIWATDWKLYKGNYIWEIYVI